MFGSHENLEIMVVTPQLINFDKIYGIHRQFACKTSYLSIVNGCMHFVSLAL